jgi:hypothetical protein
MLPGIAAFRLRGALHHVPCAVQIGVDDGVPAFHRNVDRGLRKLPAGAVDQNVETAMLRPDAIEDRRDRVRLADVDRMPAAPQPARGEGLDEDVELGLAASGDDDMRAEPREQPRRRAADAAGAAGDQRDLAAQRSRRIDGGVDAQRVVVEAEARRVSHRASCPSEVRPR